MSRSSASRGARVYLRPVKRPMSPSSRGLIPGLFLALAAAFAILTLNNHWLLPAVDDDGVAYLVAAPHLAEGQAPAIPIVDFDATEATTGLGNRGTAMPLAMAGIVRTGSRPHVAALWVLALSAALALLTAAWVAGGVAGIPGALVAGLALAGASLTLEAVTAVRPEVLVMALVGLLLGLMTYRPGWSALHGVPAALAWLAHPVGVGAVAAAVLWPLRRTRRRRDVAATALAAFPAVVLLALPGLLHGTLVPPGLPGLTEAGPASAVAGLLGWLGAGFGGVPGPLLGLLVAIAVVAMVLFDVRTTPTPAPDVHWSDPAASDALAAALRPAAGLLLLGLGAAAVLTAKTGGALTRPWAPMALPLAVLATSAAVRLARRGSGARSVLPAAVLIVWMSVSSVNAVLAFRDIRAEGRGHTAKVWVQSEVIRWLDNRSKSYQVLYATDPALVLFQTQRIARGMPSDSERHAAFVARFRMEPGPVVLTGDGTGEAEALMAELGLVEIVRAPEGRILVPGARLEASRP